MYIIHTIHLYYIHICTHTKEDLTNIFNYVVIPSEEALCVCVCVCVRVRACVRTCIMMCVLVLSSIDIYRQCCILVAIYIAV